MANVRKKKSHPFPNDLEVHTIDELAYMSSDELESVYNHLLFMRDELKSAGRDLYWVEVEIAYALREFDIRNIRRECHAEWLRSLDGEDVVIESEEDTRAA